MVVLEKTVMAIMETLAAQLVGLVYLQMAEKVVCKQIIRVVDVVEMEGPVVAHLLALSMQKIHQ